MLQETTETLLSSQCSCYSLHALGSTEKMLDEPCMVLVQDLHVQCEAQVLLFVLDYIDGTQVDPTVAAQLFQHVSPVQTSCLYSTHHMCKLTLHVSL